MNLFSMQNMQVHNKPTLPMWLGRLRTLLWGIPLLVVSCGTAPQPSLQGQGDLMPPREASHPQAYYHFLQGSLAELNNDGTKALEEYKAGLAFDPDSIFLKFRLAKLHFAMAHMTAAVDLAKQIPAETISNPAMFLDIAKIFVGAGDTEQALQVLKGTAISPV